MEILAVLHSGKACPLLHGAYSILMTPRSLQNRLLLSFLVSMTAILVGGGFVIYKVIGQHLESENDALLRDRLNFFEACTRLRSERGVVIPFFNIVDVEWARISDTGNPDLVQGWVADTGKEILGKSPALAALNESLPRPAVSEGSQVFVDHRLPDGREARFISSVFVPLRTDQSIAPVRIQLMVGRDLEMVNATLHKVRSFLVKIGLAVTGAVLLASLYIIRRGVRPVNALTKQIDVIPLAEDGGRFALPGAPSELQPVVGRLNALMDRVGAAIEHERQFASNAAHELRNPLAAIRSTIEVALSRTRKPEEYEETLDSIWQSQQGMQRVVDHLLLLARLESGHRQTEFITEPAGLGRLLKKAWLGCIDLAESKKLRVAWMVEDADTEMRVVVSLLNIVFTNMLENAVNYTPPGGEIRIHACIDRGRCLVTVENTNPGLTRELLEQTFAPFWRADPNASGHRGNAGIGLALCRRIADTLHGSIDATLTESGMVRYAADFPAGNADAPLVMPARATAAV